MQVNAEVIRLCDEQSISASLRIGNDLFVCARPNIRPRAGYWFQILRVHIARRRVLLQVDIRTAKFLLAGIWRENGDSDRLGCVVENVLLKVFACDADVNVD